jgi:hypothetical protein
MRGVFAAFLLVLLSACKSAQVQAPVENSASIGSASMDSDRMIIVMLRAEDGQGAVGDAALFMKPGHKDYQKTLQHVGGLKPGQTKPYPAHSEGR